MDEETDDVEVIDINTSVCVARTGKGKSFASTTGVTESTTQGMHSAAGTITTMASAVAPTASRRVSVKTMASLMNGAAAHAVSTMVELAAATASSGLSSVSAAAIPTDDQTIATALPPTLEENSNVEGAEMVPLGVFQPRKHLVRTPPKPILELALVLEPAHTVDGLTGATASSSADVSVVVGVVGLADADTLTGTVAGAEVSTSSALRGEEEVVLATTATEVVVIQTLSDQSVVADDSAAHQVAACEEPRSPSTGGAVLMAQDEDQLALWSAADLENVSRAIGRVSMGMSGEPASSWTFGN